MRPLRCSSSGAEVKVAVRVSGGSAGVIAGIAAKSVYCLVGVCNVQWSLTTPKRFPAVRGEARWALAIAPLQVLTLLLLFFSAKCSLRNIAGFIEVRRFKYPPHNTRTRKRICARRTRPWSLRCKERIEALVIMVGLPNTSDGWDVSMTSPSGTPWVVQVGEISYRRDHPASPPTLAVM